MASETEIELNSRSDVVGNGNNQVDRVLSYYMIYDISIRFQRSNMLFFYLTINIISYIINILHKHL